MSGVEAPVAFWLVPADDDRQWLADLIATLAAQFDAPVFEPHITLHVGRCDRAALPRLLERAASQAAPLALTAGPTAHTEQLFKALYVEFDDARVAQLRELLLAGGELGGDYTLAPHLSLLYKRLDENLRTRLAHCHRLDGRTIAFDTVVAVQPAAGHATLADVASWDTGLRRRLGSGAS